ncbi:PAS fold family [Methylocaldum marinum]|uniref:histidine kinase n=1 Tax=Methylocaldum marinum TaxID=1432792 RepID=A0A250KR48_9GAMM|nr:PAS fold family [Methylocaldum marinum]
MLATTVIAIIQYFLLPLFVGSPPLLLFLLGVALAAWYGSFRAGLFATVLSTLASIYYLIEPLHSWQIVEQREWLRTLLLFIVGGVLGLMISLLRSGERKALLEVLRQKERLEREIVERQRAEKALSAAHTEVVNERNRLEAIMETLPVGVAILDAQGGIIGSNRAVDQVWGGPCPPVRSISDYAVFKAWWVDTEEPVRPEEWAPMQVLKKGEPVVGQLMKILRFDGARAIVHNSAAPIRDATGRIAGAAVVVMDISESVRREQALRESEERYRLAIDAAQMGTWDWDLGSRKVVGNPRHAALFGYPPKETEMTEQMISDRIYPEDVPHVAAAVDEAKEHHIRYDCDFRIAWPDGSVRWVSSIGDFHYDAHGAPVRMIGVLRDITDRKQAEEALLEADRQKNEFIAMLGHELRNPLAPIRNAVHLMRKVDSPDPNLRWARDVVDRQLDHLVRLVNDLLDVSRIVQGKLALHMNLVELVTVINQAVETSHPLIEFKHHVLSVTLPEEPVYLEGDQVRLVQVVSNLLDNAAKYTPEGGRIWLSASTENGEVAITVRDTGEGISRSLLPHLFDAFTQAARPLDRPQGGLGLGLMIVQKIVEMHGGQVEVKSEGLGQGSEFVIRLPLCEQVCVVPGR